MSTRPFVSRHGLPVVPVLKGTASMHEFPILTPDSARRLGKHTSANELLSSTTCVQSGTFYKWSQPCTDCMVAGTGATCTFTQRLKFVEVLEARPEAYREWEVQFFADCQVAFHLFNKSIAPFDKQRFSMLSQVEAIHDFTRLSYLHMLFGVYDYPTDVKTLVIQRMQGMQEAFELSAVEDCMVQEIVRLSLYRTTEFHFLSQSRKPSLLIPIAISSSDRSRQKTKTDWCGSLFYFLFR
ncbi:hypothetical protein R3P38DRAFT_2766823 [Favolaschia claudopus]|uniref:Uncharacterized protein n=1 Tax=Favolaschia claudopus TaxID=2862362 RepID=A0AAV9YZQ7_9AGAR